MSARLSTLVAGGLVGVLLLAVTSLAVLAGLDKPTPGVLENLASGALGALAALLARVGGTEDVRVVNAPDQPVPVDPEAGYGEVDMLTAVLAVLAIVVLLLIVL